MQADFQSCRVPDEEQPLPDVVARVASPGLARVCAGLLRNGVVLWAALLVVVLVGRSAHADEMVLVPAEEVYSPETILVREASTADAAPAPVQTQTQTQVEEDRSSGTTQDVSCILRDEKGRFQGWVDYQHCVFSGRTTASARWFDDLFGEWSDEEAAMMVRVVTEAGWDEENGFSSAARIRAKADLPNAKERLRLVITDEEEANELPTQEERVAPQTLRRLRDTSSVALRWFPRVRHNIRTDLDIGVRGGPEIYTRLRLRRQWGLTEDSVLKAAQTFRYGTESLGVSSSQLDAERAVSGRSVLRLSTVYRFAENDHDDGFVWTHGLSMSHVFREYSDASLGYGFSVSGHTRPDIHKESYGPWLVWRQSFWRDWLYYEIEPRLTHYRELDWDRVPSLVVRLEAQFGNYHKK